MIPSDGDGTSSPDWGVPQVRPDLRTSRAGPPLAGVSTETPLAAAAYSHDSALPIADVLGGSGNRRVDVLGDRAASTLLTSLRASSRPASVLLFTTDPRPSADLDVLGYEGVHITCCDIRLIADVALTDLDLIWMRGNPTWHALRALAGALGGQTVRSRSRPVVIVEGALPAVVPPTMSVGTHAAHLARETSLKEGLQQGVVELATCCYPGSTLLSCPTGRGVWTVLPQETADAMAPWVQDRQALLDALAAENRDRAKLAVNTYSLFDLVER